MFRRQGSIVVALVVVCILLYVQQGILAPRESPVFVEGLTCDKQYSELSGNLFVCPPRQVVEVCTVKDLLCYINEEDARSVLLSYFLTHTLMNGQSVCLNRDSRGVVTLRCGFMSAPRRMTLGVALHPDCMTLEDWRALPGVGNTMAQAITDNREQYGDFCRYEALVRVRGVGVKTLARWRIYF